MTAIRKYRLQANLTQEMLAHLCGVNRQTIMKYERHGYNSIRKIYLRIRQVLDTPMEELLTECLDNSVPRCMYSSRTENPVNPITGYRHAERLTYDLLALRIGATSKETARQACVRETPVDAHIKRLAAFEGMTPCEFITTYTTIY